MTTRTMLAEARSNARRPDRRWGPLDRGEGLGGRRPLVLRALAIGAVLAVMATPAAHAIDFSFGGGKIDTGKLKKAIAENAKQAYAPAKIGAVSCPSRKLKAGDVFSCTVAVADGILTIDVTQKNGKGSVVFVAREAVISLDKAESFVHDQLLAQTKVEPKVDCGSTIVKIVEPGKVVECSATAPDGSSAKFGLRVKDQNGNVTLIRL